MSSELCPKCNHYIHWHHEAPPGKALILWCKASGQKLPTPKMRCNAQIWDDPDTYCECVVDKIVMDVHRI